MRGWTNVTRERDRWVYKALCWAIKDALILIQEVMKTMYRGTNQFNWQLKPVKTWCWVHSLRLSRLSSAIGAAFLICAVVLLLPKSEMQMHCKINNTKRTSPGYKSPPTSSGKHFLDSPWYAQVYLCVPNTRPWRYLMRIPSVCVPLCATHEAQRRANKCQVSGHIINARVG